MSCLHLISDGNFFRAFLNLVPDLALGFPTSFFRSDCTVRQPTLWHKSPRVVEKKACYAVDAVIDRVRAPLQFVHKAMFPFVFQKFIVKVFEKLNFAMLQLPASYRSCDVCVKSFPFTEFLKCP